MWWYALNLNEKQRVQRLKKEMSWLKKEMLSPREMPIVSPRETRETPRQPPPLSPRAEPILSARAVAPGAMARSPRGPPSLSQREFEAPHRPTGELAPWDMPAAISPRSLVFARRFTHTGTGWPTNYDGWLMSSPRCDVNDLPRQGPKDSHGTVRRAAHAKPFFKYCDGGARERIVTPGLPGFVPLLST